MVAAEGTIESLRFGSAFNGFTADRLREKFTAGDGRWGQSNGWKLPNWGTAGSKGTEQALRRIWEKPMWQLTIQNPEPVSKKNYHILIIQKNNEESCNSIEDKRREKYS